MELEDKISIGFVVVLALIIVGGLVWMLVDSARMKRMRTAALTACWECGWGRVEPIQGEYRCLILEGGAEAVRTIEWVQENACNVLER